MHLLPNPDTLTRATGIQSYLRSPSGCCLCQPKDILGSSLTSDRVNAMTAGTWDYRSALNLTHCNGMAETSPKRVI